MRAKDITERFQKLIPVVIENLPVSHSLIHRLRSCDAGKGRRTRNIKNPFNDAEYSLLKKIEEIDIVSNVNRTSTATSWTVNSDEDAKFLLTGDWLEYCVFHYASSMGKSQSETVFDECGWSVKDSAGKGEIDFAGIFGGQVILVSCKTEDSIKRAWFEELHSKAEQLGRGMCSTLLVSSVSKRDRTEKDLSDYEKWASERQIVLVMAEDVSRIPDILRKVIIGDKKADPQHIPCYPRI